MPDGYNRLAVRLGWLLMVGSLLSGCDKLFSLDHVKDYAGPDAAPPCAPRSVSAGRSHTCVIDYRGRVQCVGQNYRGEASPGGANNIQSPTIVPLDPEATQVAVGKVFSCALLVDQTVWCWGSSDDNIQNTGPGNDEVRGPTKIAGLPPVVEIATGGYHACARSAESDGGVWCWGGNRSLESGQPATSLDCDPGSDVDPCAAPAKVPGTEGAKALALGHKFSCIIDGNDRVACWGRNGNNQLGFSGNDTATPTVITAISDAISIGGAGKTICVAEKSGDVTCLGGGDDGQLGTGAFADFSSGPVGAIIEDARKVAVNNFGACATRSDGSIWCWGNTDGASGAYTTTLAPTASSVLTGASQISSHFYHSCAIVGSDAMCWGSNADGQLGRGIRSIETLPKTPIGLPVVDKIAAGTNHMCAVTPTSAVYCWGDNDYGQSGDNASRIRYYVPTLVPTGVTAISGIAAGFNQTCVWGGGTAQCWGKAWDGRLGTSSSDNRSLGPTTISEPSTQTQVVVGGSHICILKSAGTVRCYGLNSEGQLGADPAQGTTRTDGVSVTIASVTKLAAGAFHTCALSSGGVYCWGRNEEGQLGRGSKTDNEFNPAQVTIPGTVIDLAAGESFNCALNNLGDVYCWGRNANGQLGIDSTAEALTPVKVILPSSPNLVTTIFIGPGTSSVCARRTDNSVLCWGDGDFGQLGNAMTTDDYTPSVSNAFAGVSAGPNIAVGTTGTCAIVAGGVVKCTGEWRVLGNDDKSQSVPAPIDLKLGSCDQ